MYLLIDNYDSFTYNLYQAFAALGIILVVKRNDKVTIKEIEALNPDKIIISPGPKTPDEAGISNKVIKKFASRIPILGICLGHQCIAKTFGGTVSRLDKILHGKTSRVYHDGKDIFRGLPDPLEGARYHSLTVTHLPEELEITAWTKDDVIMGLRHRRYPVMGLQFHPESFLTEKGYRLIKNFIDI